MVSQFVRTEIQDGVFVITMVDDKTRNALGPEMTAQLIEALDTFEASPELRVLVLTGQDPAFCSGANVLRFQEQIGQLKNISNGLGIDYALMVTSTPLEKALSYYLLKRKSLIKS